MVENSPSLVKLAFMEGGVLSSGRVRILRDMIHRAGQSFIRVVPRSITKRTSFPEAANIIATCTHVVIGVVGLDHNLASVMSSRTAQGTLTMVAPSFVRAMLVATDSASACALAHSHAYMPCSKTASSLQISKELGASVLGASRSPSSREGCHSVMTQVRSSGHGGAGGTNGRDTARHSVPLPLALRKRPRTALSSEEGAALFTLAQQAARQNMRPFSPFGAIWLRAERANRVVEAKVASCPISWPPARHASRTR